MFNHIFFLKQTPYCLGLQREEGWSERRRRELRLLYSSQTQQSALTRKKETIEEVPDTGYVLFIERVMRQNGDVCLFVGAGKDGREQVSYGDGHPHINTKNPLSFTLILPSLSFPSPLFAMFLFSVILLIKAQFEEKKGQA